MTAFPDDMHRRFQLAVCYQSQAEVLQATERSEEAIAYFDKVVRLLEEITTHPPVDPSHRQQLSASYAAYGRVLERAGRVQASQELLMKSMHASADLAQDFPHVPAYREGWRLRYYELAHQLPRRGTAADEAESICREAIQLAERLVTRWPTIASFQEQLATAEIDLGYVLLIQGRAADAEPLFEHAKSLAETLVANGQGSGVRPWARMISARAIMHLGLTYMATARNREAEQAFLQAIPITQQLVDNDPRWDGERLTLSLEHKCLGELLYRLGRTTEAETHLRHMLGDATGIG